MTQILTTVLPGDQAQTVTTVDPAGYATVGVEVRRRQRWGASAYPGSPTATMLRAFPATQYLRDFGADGPDADRLPDLPAHGTGKMAVPQSTVVHVSWKSDVGQLGPWLDGLTRPVYLTWYHEPHGDVDPATYRAAGARMSRIIAQHPRGHLVLGHGPIVTRWWLVEGKGDPSIWWYEGATFFGTDVYNDSSSRYRSAEEMFGRAAQVARERGVPWLVPEYGIERLASDITGAGRAKAMREHAAWLRAQPDLLAVGWWDHGGDVLSTLPAGAPERAAWAEILAGTP